MHEVTITSDNGRCSLTVRIEPTGEGATGASGGGLPLPLIWPDLLTFAESIGAAQVEYHKPRDCSMARPRSGSEFHVP